MKIVVFVKQVPDSTANVVVENGQIDWGDAPLVINPWDEIAVEAALMQKESLGAEVVAVSLGSEGATEALKHALAMGCTEAVLISDPALETLDSLAAARVLAAALEKVGSVDLAIFGRQSIDSETGLTASQAARLLSWPSLTLVSEIKNLDSDAGKVIVSRTIEEGQQVVEAHLPAVLSVGKDFAEPRFPSFLGKRKAAKVEIPVWSLGDLGIEAPVSVIDWAEKLNPPEKDIVTEMITGSSAGEIAEKLAEKIIVEKIL